MDKQRVEHGGRVLLRQIDATEIEVKGNTIFIRQFGAVTGEAYTVSIPREYWGMVLNAIDKALVEAGLI